MSASLVDLDGSRGAAELPRQHQNNPSVVIPGRQVPGATPVSSSRILLLCKEESVVIADPNLLPCGSTIAVNLDPFGSVSHDQWRNIPTRIGLRPVVQVQGGGSVDIVLQSASLSQGQRQLLSLARAVLKRKVGRARLPLLDEFTSSVDMVTEGEMMELIMTECRDATVVMVSYRLGVVVDMFDRVLGIDEGRLVEDRALAQTEESRFPQLL